MKTLQNKFCVLVTKTLTREQLKLFSRENLDVISLDFISIKPLFPKEILVADFVIITSQNALHILKYLPKNQKIMCVGEKTQQKITNFGFDVVESRPYAKELREVIQKYYFNKTFILLVGDIRGNELPTLKEKGVQIKEITVYKNEPSPKRIVQSFDAVLFFSPSGVKSFLMNNSLEGKRVYCIGSTTQEALKGYPSIKAITPTIEATIEACIDHLNK